MPQIEVTINNRSYRLACEEGEENHLRELSRYIDRQVDAIKGEFGQIGDARLLVMASLTIADKLSETFTKLEKLETEVNELRGQSKRLRVDTDGLKEATAKDLDNLASRIEVLTRQIDDV